LPISCVAMKVLVEMAVGCWVAGWGN